MDNEILVQIVSERSPIRIIKVLKSSKVEIERLLAGSQYSPQIRLRGYLTINQIPPQELVTEQLISKSLTLEDSLRFLPRLGRAMRLLDVEVPLAAISNGLSLCSHPSPRRLAANLGRIIAKWTVPGKGLELTQKSLYELIRLIVVLVECDRTGRPRSKPITRKEPPRNPFVQLVKHVVTLAKSSEQRVRLLSIELIATLYSARTIDMEELLSSDANFRSSAEELLERAIQDVEGFGLEGRVEEFEQCVNAVRTVPINQGQIESRLEAWHETASRFPEEIQGRLKSLLGMSDPVTQALPIAIDQADSVQTTQLATVLLRAWDAKEEGPNAKEVFEQLSSVLDLFFEIRLRGTVGETEKYNPRIHEMGFGERPTQRIKVVRPWVEFSDQGVATVVIKAIVQSQD